jgi:hypothetical protein
MTGFELFTCWKRCLKISRTSSTVITISWLQWLNRVTAVCVHCSLLEGIAIGEPYSQSGCCHWCCLCIVPFLKASLLENLIRSPGVAIGGVYYSCESLIALVGPWGHIFSFSLFSFLAVSACSGRYVYVEAEAGCNRYLLDINIFPLSFFNHPVHFSNSVQYIVMIWVYSPSNPTN